MLYPRYKIQDEPWYRSNLCFDLHIYQLSLKELWYSY